MKKIVRKIISLVTPVIIIFSLLGIFSNFRYEEKPTPEETKVIEKFYESHKK